MPRKPFALIISLVLVFTISGCSNYLHAAIPLPITEPDYQSEEVAIAVDLAGIKHIARTECPIVGSDPCKLVYTRVMPGLPGLSETAYSWIPPSNEQVYDVDIAVTDSGYAYIVFRVDGRVGASVASELYAMRNDFLGIQVLIEGTYEVTGKPIAVARGGNVYVAYDVLYTTYNQVRYFNLTNPAVKGWVEQCFPTAPCVLNDAAVGWNGSLYVVYTLGAILEYSDNYGVSGDMTNHVLVSTIFSSKAAIDVNGTPETVYIIYDDTREFPGFSNGLFINHCLAASCTVQTIDVAPMPDGELWRLQGTPQVIANVLNTAYYIFIGTNNTIPNVEVFAGSFQVGSPSTFEPVTRMTDSPVVETDERLCLTWSLNPVAAWRLDLGGGAFGDISEYGLTTGIRPVRQTTSGRAGVDLACNADWGAGIWNELTTGKRQAWVSFNTYPNLLPMITK
jgi:hypothetical protein